MVNVKKKKRGSLLPHLNKFIQSNGGVPHGYQNYIHGGNHENLCVLCRKVPHYTHLEYNQGKDRCYICSSCAGTIQTSNYKTYRRLLMSSKRISSYGTDLLSQYLSYAKINSSYLDASSCYKNGNEQKGCYFCGAYNTNTVEFNAPIGTFPTIERSVQICTGCEEEIDANVFHIEKHVVPVICGSCENEYYLTEKELVSRISCTLAEYYDVPDNIRTAYRAHLSQYKCDSCIISNRPELEGSPRMVKLCCANCGDPHEVDVTFKDGPDNPFYCKSKSCKPINNGSEASFKQFLEKLVKKIEKKKPDFKEGNKHLLHTKEKKQAAEIEAEIHEQEYGFFSDLYMNSKFRFIIRRFTDRDYNEFYYYNIYEHVPDLPDDLDFIPETYLNTPYGLLSLISDSLDIPDKNYNTNNMGLYACIDDARKFCHHLLVEYLKYTENAEL